MKDGREEGQCHFKALMTVEVFNSGRVTHKERTGQISEVVYISKGILMYRIQYSTRDSKTVHAL